MIRRSQLTAANLYGSLRFVSADDPARRLGARLVIALWVYALALSALVLGRRITGGTGELPAFALLVPPQAVLTFLMWSVLSHGGLSRARLMGWSLMLAATIFDILGAVDWSYVASITSQPFGTAADVLYMINYALLACAAGAFFVSCGGSFRRPRVWVDAAIVGFAAIAALLPLLFSPLLEPRPAYVASATASLGYALGIGVTVTGLTMLLMQVRDWRRDAGMILYIIGIAAAMVTDVFSIAANVRGHFDLGNVDHVCWVWADAWVGTAALMELNRHSVVGGTRHGEGNSTSLLPVLAILVSLVIVLGAGKHHTGFSVLATVVLLVSGAALVVARQVGVRYELARLNAELAQRQAEARFTELVRRSADMIAVVTADGVVSYASPAAISVVGSLPETLVGTRACDLLGSIHAARLSALLDETVSTEDAIEIEVREQASAGRGQVVQIVASNELSNPLLKAIVLTARDVTEQRSTEREVLDIAALERQRFAAEVHEGIGQELVGVTLMLRGLAAGWETDPDVLREALVPIVDQLNGVVASVRGLARGLSPLAVVHGSLPAALKSLATDIEAVQRIPVRVRCADTPAVDAAVAEHLYYIAREAIGYAVRRRSCKRIDLELRASEQDTVLAIWDYSMDIPGSDEAVDELPLRLIAYRSRLIAGSLKMKPLLGSGRWIEVTVRAPA
ncbi:MAG: PAS domain-containing protein [Steroidobacteraceae bacterium]